MISAPRKIKSVFPRLGQVAQMKLIQFHQQFRTSALTPPLAGIEWFEENEADEPLPSHPQPTNPEWP